MKGLHYEGTMFYNIKLIVDDLRNEPIAVEIDGHNAFYKGDRVLVSSDSNGYICPGICHAGYGRIEEIVRDDSDHFFKILMDNGERGICKEARIKYVAPRRITRD